ncbi:conserved hypothetical protein [Candidatus Terasakiella magnetica]|uniref:Regulator of CtrA degradation n=1 Tax=Candidatus Terasakiella magnetica TaxID=1867952 RepID=A0A1C3RKD5_9PROT|nr:DUF1465 family protein [Candidatus Terasakiella magnetica]SCA57706.1 conserved hypothetical protein [Candidatus Terasakiella magnetica]
MGKVATTVNWLDRTFDETMSLLIEAEQYHAYRFEHQVRHLVPVKRLALTKESLRVTSRLSHMMSWLMSEKAILNDEITRQDFAQNTQPLAQEDICVEPTNTPIEDCPRALQSLRRRSWELFMRATRIEGMLRQ